MKVKRINENLKKNLKEGYLGQTLNDFLSDCTNESEIELILYGDSDEPIFKGTYDECDDYLMDSEFIECEPVMEKSNWNFSINVTTHQEDCGSMYETIDDFLADVNCEEVTIWNLDREEEIYKGDPEDIPEEIKDNYLFCSFDSTDKLIINLSGIENDEIELDIDDEEELDESTSAYSSDKRVDNFNGNLIMQTIEGDYFILDEENINNGYDHNAVDGEFFASIEEAKNYLSDNDLNENLDEKEQLDMSVSGILNRLIIEKLGIIDNYNSAIVTISALGEDKTAIIDALKQIANDEFVQVGKLQNILAEVDPNAQALVNNTETMLTEPKTETSTHELVMEPETEDEAETLEIEDEELLESNKKESDTILDILGYDSWRDYYNSLCRSSLDEINFELDDIDKGHFIFGDGGDVLRLTNGDYYNICWRGSLCRIWREEDPETIKDYDSQIMQKENELNINEKLITEDKEVVSLADDLADLYNDNLEESNSDEKTCCLCGKKFKGWGNNPWPVKEDKDAVCCDDCNMSRVIPARMQMLNKKKRNT